MWCTPTKQGTSDILGEMRFWYHCTEHMFSFNLITKSSSYTYFLNYDHLFVRLYKRFLWMWFWEISLLKFPIPIDLDMTGCRKCRILWGNVWKSVRKLYGGGRKHIKACEKKKKISKSTDELFFTPCQLLLFISQNKLVRLVPSFVGVHHMWSREKILWSSHQIGWPKPKSWVTFWICQTDHFQFKPSSWYIYLLSFPNW